MEAHAESLIATGVEILSCPLPRLEPFADRFSAVNEYSDYLEEYVLDGLIPVIRRRAGDGFGVDTEQP